MGQRKIEHPDKPSVHALYGWDRSVEFFVTVFEDARRIAEYDRLQPGYRDMQGVVELLAEHGFFAPEDIGVTNQQLAYLMPEEFDDPAMRRCAEVIIELRRSAM